MKSKKIEKHIKSNISEYDIVSVKTNLCDMVSKYLLVAKNKSSRSVDLVPVDSMLSSHDSTAVVPVISMPIDMILEINKESDNLLFYLIDRNNPHIINAINKKFS